jgi:DNA-binding MarR family transcriptional regulator
VSVADDETARRRALAFDVFREIGIINQLANARLQRALAGVPGALSTSEFSVLGRFVRLGDGETPSRLAKLFQMSKPSMTAIVAKLEAKGFAAVEPDPADARSKIVTITKAGRTAYRKAQAATLAQAEDFLTSFDVGKLKAILPTLAELRAWMDEARNEADGLG